MDTAKKVVDFVYATLQIDERWALRNEERFTWWGGAQAQRVWAEAAQEREGTLVTPVHIETDLLRKVQPSVEVFERLGGINRLATLSAYVADPDTTAIRLHASVSVTNDNLHLAQALALHATALQVSDAHAEAAPLAEIFGGQVDSSLHPTAGARDYDDAMLDAANMYAARGEHGSPFGDVELAELVRLEPRPWIGASVEAKRLDAELPFDGAEPTRLVLDAAYRHPALGGGLRITLTIPVPATPSRVQGLNTAELIAPDAHQLGGWCASEDDRLMFVAFIPAGAYLPHLARAMVYHMATRNGWAHELLTRT